MKISASPQRQRVQKKKSFIYYKLFFSWNFNDSWFVDYSGCTVALLDDADDPGLVAFLFFDVFAVRGRLFAWQTNQ